MDSIFSSLWYRVEHLRPRLRTHLEFRRHQYRNQPWFVLYDKAGGRTYRFDAQAYLVLALMNGRRTVQQVWDAINTERGDDAPTQDEMIGLLARLHASDLLQCDVSPDSAEVFSRYQKLQRGDWKQRLWSPLAVRIPVWDPDRCLQGLLPLARLLFSKAGAVVWFLLVFLAAILALSKWPELSANFTERVLNPGNLIILWLVYPLVKWLHEMGHALAVKVRGGEVHEMGIMLLALMPIPYVDASASSAFRNKHHRMLVGAAGMMVEMLLAAIALLVWMQVEPGLVRTIAFNVMLIGGVSTLLFNGNPLLRFDAYYILSDAVEIPNLGSRANQQIGYLIQRYLFGLPSVTSSATSLAEAVWLVVYAITSFMYRMSIMVFIILFIAKKFFAVGVILAIWATITQLFVPLVKQLMFLFNNQDIQPRRTRAITVSGMAVSAVLAVLLLVPAPNGTRAEGVVWLPEHAQVRAGTDCFVEKLLAQPGAYVHIGDALISCQDPVLPARIRILQAKKRELEIRYAEKRMNDLVQAAVAKEEIIKLDASLAREQQRLDSLLIRSQAQGVLIVPNESDLPGRYIHQGDLIAYVVDQNSAVARVVVPQRDAGLVRQHTRKVEVRSVDQVDRLFATAIQREVPAASEQLPHKALGAAGGGSVSVSMSDEKGLTASEKVFQFDVVLPEEWGAVHPGKRIYARFDHGFQPLAGQWYRRIRQLFLREFNV